MDKSLQAATENYLENRIYVKFQCPYEASI